ncbi:MAG: glycosyltransferase family 4 protein [Anaerolineales bacterium]
MRAMVASFRRWLRKPNQPELYYIAPGVNWVLDWEAKYITREVEKQFGLKASISRSVSGLSGQIIHCASLWELTDYVQSRLSRRNAVVGTIYHGQKEDKQFQGALEKVLDNKGNFVKLHTASQIMQGRLLAWGVPSEKVTLIPEGVDLKNFYPVTKDQRLKKREQLGIPAGAFCIGSFHKDGVGMGDGNDPKMIKGPDIFLKVIEAVNKHHPVFVLLSAPARGYVKSGLENLGIQYRHVVLDDYLQVPSLYHAADLYLMTSREEGGPKAVLESMATGIPVVATQVGLVPDVIIDGETGLLADSEDIETLAGHVLTLISRLDLRQRLVEGSLKSVRKYDWPLIATRYYHEIYEPILAELAH